jgi:hypothetical protein
MIGPNLVSLFRAKVPAGLSKKMLDQKSNLASLVIVSNFVWRVFWECMPSYGLYVRINTGMDACAIYCASS